MEFGGGLWPWVLGPGLPPRWQSGGGDGATIPQPELGWGPFHWKAEGNSVETNEYGVPNYE